MSLSGGTATLTAPGDASYFTFYSATNLAPPVAWVPLTNAPVLIGNEWRVTLPSGTTGQRYFHLQRP
jgi:hypothetical protein